MRKIVALFILVLAYGTTVLAQDVNCYPTNWWIGMNNPKVQVMLHGKDIGKNALTVSPYPGVVVEKITPAENPNYIFVDLLISGAAKPGNLQFLTKSGKAVQTTSFPLKARRSGNGTEYAQGIRSEDLMYLLIPDRFSNGDTSNDRIAGLRDQSLNRDSIYDRHGGDLKGIINHLDYLQDLGVTAVWPLPVWQNNMPNRTEHGYAITNHYVIEPRLGTNEDYKTLANELHKRNMKLVQDVIYNHVGLYHLFVQDKPMKDWLHEWPSYTGTNYKDQILFDPYASSADKKTLLDGWFTRMMPDLNHGNPYVANFLIQHAIWSVEEFGVDGWRIDTYIYNDLEFMNRCNKALLDEYPKISIFGETWVHGVPNQAYFTENNLGDVPFKSNLPGTTDFQTLFYGIQETLTKPFGWTDGVNKLYTTAAQDYMYKDPMKQVIFLDNHDLARFYSVIGEDTAKYKIALSWLLTFRGIPQLYYGNELLMTGFTNPDGWVRLDFQGGWPNDKVNKFTAAGRTEKENAVFDHIKKLAQFRKTSAALKTGKMMQFVPEDGVYVYFRYEGGQTIMCIMNTDANAKTIKGQRFTERTAGFTSGTDVPTGKRYDISGDIALAPMSMLVLELF